MRFRISIGGHTTSQNDPEMQKAVLALVHTRIPAILVANIVNSSLLLLVFIDTSARVALMIWYALIILTVACFGALWFTYRDQNEADWSRRWGSTVFICHGIGGLLWGAAGVLFFMPQSVIHFTVLAFVLGGMAAGALATLSIHLPTFHAYVFPSLLPFCVRLAVEGGTANLAMAAMFLMYIVAIVAVAPQTRDAIAQTFALRFENRALLLGLEHRVRDRTRRHASVVDFSQRALSGLETDKLLQEAALIVAEGLPATCAAVMELLPGRDMLAVRSTAGWKGDVFTPATVSAKSGTVSGYALLTGEPTVSHDPRADTRFEIPPELRERGIVSMIVVPIWGERTYYGTLEAWSTEPPTIADDDVHFIRAVATTVAAALQRRRSEELAQHLALHDPLTGLPNRSLFRDYLSQALSGRSAPARCWPCCWSTSIISRRRTICSAMSSATSCSAPFRGACSMPPMTHSSPASGAMNSPSSWPPATSQRPPRLWPNACSVPWQSRSRCAASRSQSGSASAARSIRKTRPTSMR